MSNQGDGALFHREEYRVLPVSQRICERMVAQYHYARSCSNTAAYRHGLFHRSDMLACLGVAQWLPPTRDAAKASWEGDWHSVLALSRLVIAPSVPTNGASYLIGQSIKIIRREGRFRCLVTYADTWQEHSGAIYKATNWEYIGMTEPQARWVDPATGTLISKYAGGVSRSREEMEALGYENAGKFATHKFRIILPAPRGRKVALADAS